tara:strand:- start:69 stop:428 length:360 start_codon:yes stop_codon:yes gene_type:complete
MNIGDSIILASGTVTLTGSGTGSGDNVTVSTGIQNANFYPVTTVVPVGDYANVNAWVKTDVVFDSGQWKFKIIRSIGQGTSDNTLEDMSFRWSVVALKNVQEIGPAVTTESETAETYTP